MEPGMSRNNNPRKKYTRNEKVFYGLSILIVLSMVLSQVYMLLTPTL